MASDWPIDAPPAEGRRDPAARRPAVDGDRRLAAVLQDFFLPADTRLTEQERALMTAMLHGLIGRIADEIRARLDPLTAEACASEPAELVSDLSQAGLLQDQALIGLLLRRADVQRLAARANGGRTRLQRWTSSEDADVAAAAMALITARGRGRDRFGRAALDLADCPPSLAARLIDVVAAALGGRCSVPSDADVAAAAADLVASSPPGERLEVLEQGLAAALDRAGAREPNLLEELARDGEAPLLAAILAREADIPAEEGWRCLLGGGEQVALLLRMGRVSRVEAAALLAHSGPALGIGDPVLAIDHFDRLDDQAVEAARAQLALPPGYRRAQALLAYHG